MAGDIVSVVIGLALIYTAVNGSLIRRQAAARRDIGLPTGPLLVRVIFGVAGVLIAGTGLLGLLGA